MSEKEWNSYRKGIKVMKMRSEANVMDPTGFVYQSRIHAWPEYNGSAQAYEFAVKHGWHQSQHLQYLSLVWHRMYLYFFERILRQAADDQHLTIPYWDYNSDDDQDLSMPEVFRLPADPTLNPLYTNMRCNAVNRGKPLKAQLTSASGPLRSRFFTIDGKDNDLNICHSFSGGRVEKPLFIGGYSGLFLLAPHNKIHENIGGPDGYLANPCLASMDPIFMVHHSQVDRIWESWNWLGGENPKDDKYLDQTFDFFDENGQRVRARVRDFNNVSALYSYDQLIDVERVVPTDIVPELYFDVINSNENMAISLQKRSIDTQLDAKTVQLFTHLAKESTFISNARITLQFSLYYMKESTFFDIYLNLPPNVEPSHQWPNFIGSIVNLSFQCMPLETNGILRSNITNCFDLTINLRQILQRDLKTNGFVGNHFNLTFIARDCDDNLYHNHSSDPFIVFNAIYLVHIF